MCPYLVLKPTPVIINTYFYSLRYLVVQLLFWIVDCGIAHHSSTTTAFSSSRDSTCRSTTRFEMIAHSVSMILRSHSIFCCRLTLTLGEPRLLNQRTTVGPSISAGCETPCLRACRLLRQLRIGVSAVCFPIPELEEF